MDVGDGHRHANRAIIGDTVDAPGFQEWLEDMRKRCAMECLHAARKRVSCADGTIRS